MINRLYLLMLCVLLLTIVAQAEDGIALAKLITQAKPGAKINVPAGTFELGEIRVPTGVTVRGAGFKQTFLVGNLLITDAANVTVTDLTVQDAPGAAFAVVNSKTVTLSSIRAQHSGVGILLDHSEGVHVENNIIAGNRAGVILRQMATSSVVNCTLTDNSEIAFNLADTRNCTVFNNLVTNSQLGVMAASDNQALALDYNLYVVLFVGSTTDGEPVRESLSNWSSRFGYDRHSLELKMDYADAKAGDYRPVTPLPWAPWHTTATNWGTTELAGVKSPTLDVTGKRRQGRPDLGAVETTPLVAAKADGRFTVSSGAGVTSAGLFTPDGSNVSWLFQNLPLAKGNYEFALPPTIKSGDYELRVAESNLSLRYVMPVGSIGVDNSLENSSSIDPALVIFDSQDNPVLFQGGAEDQTQARSFEPGMQKARWRIDGNGGAAGAVATPGGELFFIRKDGMLYKVNAVSGEGIPIAGASFRKQISNVFSSSITGMAELNGNLYVADPEKNKIFVTGSEELTFTRGIDLPSPRWPSADRKNNLLWVISGEKLLALDAAGAIKYQATPVEKPVALSVNAGRLAVYSAATRRVHIFDCSDPAKLKPLTIIGREWKPGDTNLGRINLDRLSGTGSVALAVNGDVVVLDDDAPRLFKADGTFVRAPMPIWGQFVACGWWTGADGKPELQISGMAQTQTISLNADMGMWQPGTRYTMPTINPSVVAAYFTEGGRNYLACTEEQSQKRWLVRVEQNGVGIPVMLLAPVKDKAEYTVQSDANGDNIIDDQDPVLAVNGPDGKSVTNLQFTTDGRLLAGGRIIPYKTDNKGGLTYDWSKYDPSLPAALPTGGQGNFNGGFLADGSWLAGGGPGRGFGGGYTVVSALGADGKPRWEHRLDYHNTIGSFRSARVLPDLVLGMATEELDTFFLTHDGLGLGIVGPSSDFRWTGFWHDQDWSLRSVVAPNGRQYVLLGDYVRHTAHLMEIIGLDTVTHAQVKVAVSEARAAELANAKSEPVHNPIPAKIIVPFVKLATPLPINGDLKKWRDAKVNPAIMISPAGVASDDCSALIRCGWQGDDLYFQVIKFDNVVTFHQDSNMHYKQDSTELAMNGGFMSGYKFSVTRTTDKGEIALAESFLLESAFLDAAKVPRVIRVLDNAKEVDERRLIEQAYGVDLTNSKVIITEFKLPVHYIWGNDPWPNGKRSPAAPLEMKAGTGFWFGMFIDDNDVPGTDVQKAYSWPVTFQAFGNANYGAWGVLE